MLSHLVTFTYIFQFPHSLGEQPALNVAFILGFKEFEASGVFKRAVMQEEVSLGLPYINHFPGQLLVAGGLQEVHFQTL